MGASAIAEQNVETMRRLFAAVERRDPDEFRRAYDESIAVHEAASLPYGGEYRGPEGLQRHAAGYMGTWDGLQGAAERRLDPEFVADGDRVAVLWRQRARDPVSGESLDMPTVSVYRLRDGRVVDARMFHFDTAAVSRFLTRARGGTELEAAERELNALIGAGEYVAAFERFYADDVVMQEVGGPETAGKAANQAREAAFFRTLSRLEGRLRASAVTVPWSYSEWDYRLEFRSGRTLEYRQVAAREWRGGQVIRETFYHVPFPTWMIEAAQAAAVPAGAVDP